MPGPVKSVPSPTVGRPPMAPLAIYVPMGIRKSIQTQTAVNSVRIG